MSNYIVSDTSLISVADAIRAKGGTAAALEFPAGFVSAIGNISGGSSPGQHIYGVRWVYEDDGEGGTRLPSLGTRTDEAASFNDPVPFVAGADQMAYIQSALTCGSPFDDLYPWSGMQPVKDKLLLAMVAIPKFWYKWTKTETYLQLQVATYAAEGFSLSPAHRARNANDSDRDVVYIARYHGDQMLMSAAGSSPAANMTRAAVRTAISTQMAQLQQTGYSLQDYAMFWTWRMLFLVEYRNWNGQAAIGFDCGTGDDADHTCQTCWGSGEVEGETCPDCGGTGYDSSYNPDAQTEPANNGTTDNMPYHTGTMQASLATTGQGVQYRYIEDPWGGVAEWIDGWYLGIDENTMEGYCRVIDDPAEFSDDTGGTEILRTSAENVPNGWITDWYIPDVEGYDWALLPIAGNGGDQNTSVADYCRFNGPALISGGVWFVNPVCGPFYLWSRAASVATAVIGARLQKIP